MSIFPAAVKFKNIPAKNRNIFLLGFSLLSTQLKKVHEELSKQKVFL